MRGGGSEVGRERVFVRRGGRRVCWRGGGIEVGIGRVCVRGGGSEK